MTQVPVDEFIRKLGLALGIDPTGWAARTRLVDDAGLDSLDMYEMLCTVEDWAGCELEDALVVTWETFGDVYRCFENNFHAKA